ncbi:tripartite motif-containing protein 29-like [Sinocyclocheilus grahami]|uniref:tripartite motif-containing protein 29-like n=1 Tax=Sinocyclocheilus grahami TaxID=75366 RepID=UPI0007AC54AF|nr:PREDICTED: tripartite motif-containing protein 29-like [Sinocyclocheilus grahami]
MLDSEKSEVVCEETKMKALQSCLVCQISYCETHLDLHQKVLSLKKHKLMDPVENMKDCICQKHERPLELFCRDDQTYVCVFCTDGDHKTHNTVPLEEESKEKMVDMMKTQKVVQQMIQDRIKKIQDIKHSAELRKKSKEREKAASAELFSDLMRSIKRCQAELLEMMEEKQKTAEKQDEELIQELQQEITELKMRNTELDHLLHTEDHLQLLQIDPSMCSPPHTKNWPEICMNTDVSVETLRRALTQLQENLDPNLTQSDDRKQLSHWH